MSQPVISVENLSKSYLIGHQGPRETHLTLRDTIGKHARNFARRTVDTLRGKQMLQGDSVEEFWALKDVSFEVKQGEVLGIIGRNGAGKSTLLKVLSRITEPTSGSVTIRGRVASLLEVGTGFHPELSGRENIFLNGAILGMSRKEIKAKFDEIVDFAGVEKFLDTPVKRYSSGMYVRLAFAVAAHLEPEILVVDEVLAVGDAEFQKKCLGKMKDVATQGRTVIFVSHDLHAVRRLCTSGIFLSRGQVSYRGQSDDTINTYLRTTDSGLNYSQRYGNGAIRLVSIELLNRHGESVEHLDTGEELVVRFVCNAIESQDAVMFSICFNTPENVRVASFYSSYKGKSFVVPPGRFEATCTIPKLSLMPGDYQLVTAIDAHGVMLDCVSDIKAFRVSLPKTTLFLTAPDMKQGFYVEDFNWEI
jgi:lipopolysaccharide transport system ATP-binding protein